jgi:signal transduction histidine kinase
VKNVKRFLRRFLTGLVLCFVLFAAMNVGIFWVCFYKASQAGEGSGSPQYLVRQTAESLSGTEGSGYTLPGGLKNELKKQGVWAMLLDSGGKVVWKMDLPETIPLSYSAAGIAEFSRYYLRDYPVFCWERGGGLMVLGYPKDSYFKYPYDASMQMFSQTLRWVELMFGCNVALLILLYALLSWRTVKPVEPILESIRSLSRGEPVLLQEKGLFSEISAGLNRTSVLLQSRSEALKEKEKARAEWIAGVSHDIRTPLSMILGYAGEMEDDPSLPKPARERCARICAQGVKLRDLVSDLNLVSRLEYSMQPLLRRPVRAAKLLREAVTGFLNGGVDEKFQVEIEPADETVWIDADGRLLERAVTNLLQNSAVHNPAGCRITVSLRAQEKDCLLAVEDDGIGIKPEKLRRLQAAIRSGKGLSRTGEHGLGLRIVGSIARAHGGVFRLSSEPGRGTKAVLILPRSQTPGGAAGPSQ